MAAPSTQSPPLGLPSDAVQFLQDSLHPSYTQLAPTLANPYQDYEQGVNVGDQLNAAVLSGLHAQQAQQSIAASQAAAQLAANKSPYELALLQAKTDAIPLDKKYNATLQQAQIDEMEANAAKRKAQAGNYGSAGPTIAPFSFQSQAQPPIPATPSTDATLPDFSPGSLSTPDFSLDSTSGATDDTPTPLLGAVTPSADTSLATTLPTSGDNIGGLLDRLDQTDPTGVTLADTPDQSATATSYDLPSSNTFTAKATGYHPVSPDSADYKMEGGNQDAQGNPIHTLDAFRRGEVPDVTVAVDRSSPLFGQSGFSPDLNAPVKFTDTGSAFRGKGDTRVDVARDTAAGANSDENNGNLTFQVNGTGDDTANGPLVQVSGADNPAGATVYQGGQQISGTGVVVPKSQDELTAQRNAFNAWSAQANAALSQTNNPRQQQAIKAQIASTANALKQSEQLYLAGQKRTANVTPSGNALDAYPDIPGYSKIPTKGTNGKLDVSYVSDNDAGDQARVQNYQTLRNAQELVGGQTGGATLNELLNATPSADGTTYTVTHNESRDGLDTPITRTLPAPFYNQLANIARPAVFGNPKPTTNAGNGTDAKIAALATDPEFGGRTDNVLPTGLTPMSLVLGSRVMSATPRPTYAPTPTPSVQSQLDQAVTQLPSSSNTPAPDYPTVTGNAPVAGDPLLQQANQVIAAQPPPDTTAAQQTQVDAKVKKSYAYQREQQVNAAQNEVQQKRDALSALLNPDATSGTSAPVGTVAATPAIAAATTAYKQAQAKLLATRDFNNYSLGDNGAYVYNDPFRANSGIDGFNSGVGLPPGVTTTRRVTQ